MIDYPYSDVEDFVLKLPDGLSARYFHLTNLMLEFGPNLGMPHTKPLSAGLFELRIKGKQGHCQGFLLHESWPAYCYAPWIREEDPKDTRSGIN